MKKPGRVIRAGLFLFVWLKIISCGR